MTDTDLELAEDVNCHVFGYRWFKIWRPDKPADYVMVCFVPETDIPGPWRREMLSGRPEDMKPNGVSTNPLADDRWYRIIAVLRDPAVFPRYRGIEITDAATQAGHWTCRIWNKDDDGCIRPAVQVLTERTMGIAVGKAAVKYALLPEAYRAEVKRVRGGNDGQPRKEQDGDRAGPEGVRR